MLTPEPSIYTNKTLLITGGTGTFGTAVLERFLHTEVGQIRIFSRDEAKQDAMRHRLQLQAPELARRVRFYIGDVRDAHAVRHAVTGVDYVFHAAALKQVPSCEFFPLEAIKTNVLGTENLLDAAIQAGVRRVVCLSTDKAVYPVNAMGLSKAMMEKVALAKSRTATGTKICCTRYGNVLCSRGSVVPLWIRQLREGAPLTVTDPNMTRFLMTAEEAVDLVLFAFEQGESGDILVQKAPACRLQTLAAAVCGLFGAAPETEIIGIRHGEKMYETLLTNAELARAVDLGRFCRVPCDARELQYEAYFTRGDRGRDVVTELDSNTTEQLDQAAVEALLLRVPFIRAELGLDEAKG